MDLRDTNCRSDLEGLAPTHVVIQPGLDWRWGVSVRPDDSLRLHRTVIKGCAPSTHDHMLDGGLTYP